MTFVREVRSGFYSDFVFECKMCVIEKKISSTKNTAVNSTIAVGIGYTQLSEFFAGLEVPSISANTYQFIQTNLQKEIQNTAWIKMKKAGEEEKKLALEYGNVDVSEPHYYIITFIIFQCSEKGELEKVE
ncbi:Uncharacterized protein FWK35_00023410 [Aphis craccivora]|uniref:Mutator-like transposase domain-containing protein n=1 Tax=Aphis craccivora TaxID=307492 RepID=A0A6G0VVF1_APHCR|nr:Uncharacterized protein FWK35_00023410 [Aphis craccivora]